MMIDLYHQANTRFFVRQQNILLVKLTKTHKKYLITLFLFFI